MKLRTGFRFPSPVVLSFISATFFVLTFALALEDTAHAQCLVTEPQQTYVVGEPPAASYTPDFPSAPDESPSFGLLPAGPLKDACIAKARLDFTLCEAVADAPYQAAKLACTGVAAPGTKGYDDCITIPRAKYALEHGLCVTALNVALALC